MVIQKGYKQTEIGVIPNDWEVKNLLDNFTIKARIGWQGLTTAEYLKTGDYGLVTGTDFKNGYIDWDNCVYVERERFVQDKNIQLKINDVLVTKDGTIGKVAFVDKLPNPTTLNSGVFVLRPKNENINNRFFYSLLMSFYFDSFLAKITAGSTITHLYQKDFVNFNFILPTLEEQISIATALSDADGLITGLEKLIAKKRNIKQGAMQQLLQPKEGWEVKKLGEVSDLITKGTTPTSVGREFQNKGINFIKIESLQKNGEIVKDKVAFIDEFTHNLLQRSQLKSKDILFSIAGALGRVAIVKDEILPANTNQALAIIRLKDGYLVDYIYFYLNNEKIQKYILTISVQGAQANLSLLNISELDIPFPALEEQTRIASVLTDMDAELSALEQKLEKYKRVKLGMMQELLTGKTRLN
jgi:type I restriction enzyme S subunit